MLDKHFKVELSEIYREIGKFRDGVKSLKVYNEQQQNSMDSGRGKTSLFCQILYFLSLQNEISKETEFAFQKSAS